MKKYTAPHFEVREVISKTAFAETVNSNVNDFVDSHKSTLGDDFGGANITSYTLQSGAAVDDLK